MDVQLISSILTLGILGAISGLLLQFASNIFYVEKDDKLIEIEEALPGVNCGACGYPGCSALASAIVEGNASVNQCSVGGQQVADEIAAIMGTSKAEIDKNVAKLLCGGDCDKSKYKYDIFGEYDCRIINMHYNGNKVCKYGCLGGGTCKSVCEFDAIEMIDGLPVIDKDKCTACNQCVINCPKNIIDLVPYSAETLVECNSTDKGKDVRQYCDVGCIGCSICARECPEDAIHVENFLAKIDYDKCIQCGICVEKCPTSCIKSHYEEVVKEAK